MLWIAPISLLLIRVKCSPVIPSFDPSIFDTSVSPANDFYSFVNNLWISNVTIPDDKSGVSSFHEIATVNEQRVKNLLESADINDPLFSNRLIADLFKSGMDLVNIEATSRNAIKPHLEEIGRVQSIEDALRVAMTQKKKGISRAFFGLLDSGPDLRNSSRAIAHVSEGGIGLPRSYYLDATYSDKLLKYTEYIQKLLLTGAKYSNEQALIAAADILELEIQIASATYTPVERRDINKRSNYFQWMDLKNVFPRIPWSVLAEIAKIDEKDIGQVVVDHPSFYIRISELLQSTPLSTIKSYLTLCFLSSSQRYLSKEFTDIGFELNKALSGIKSDPPRFKKVSDMLDSVIGDAIGKLYVSKYFSSDAKADVLLMIKQIKETLRDRIINEISWMSQDTKAKALEKLAAMGVKVGYPDIWVDISDLENLIMPNMTLLEKFALISQWNYETELLKAFNKPVNKAEWYYLPSGNEIVFPAAILTPPFYYPPTGSIKKDRENVVKNYAAIGAVIGHEINHGFDDNGKQYGKTGNLESWWTATDVELFKKRSDLLISQYDQYQLLGKNVSGALTVGENIADLGGCVTSFYAMKIALAGLKDSYHEGLTNEQRYFVYYARLWRSKYRDESMLRLLESDPHSPSNFRVNGIVSNMKEFYDAFGAKKGNLLYREERVEIF